MVRSPKIFRNCLGFSFVLRGQKRVPDPPAMITACSIDNVQYWVFAEGIPSGEF